MLTQKFEFESLLNVILSFQRQASMFPKSETEQPIIKSGACNIDGNLSKVGANCEEERQPIL